MYRSFHIAILLLLFVSLFSAFSLISWTPNVAAGSCNDPSPLNTDLLAIYILAFDNSPQLQNGTTNPYNLTPKHDPTVEHLRQQSVGLIDRQALIFG